MADNDSRQTVELSLLAPEIQQALSDIGITALTEVQEKTIPAMRTGADVVVKAPTGTGKTFAFGIPITETVELDSPHIQVLVLAPTRELAIQIDTELQRLTAHVKNFRTAVLYGGHPIQTQITHLKQKPQVVVATPGRLLDHVGRRTIQLDHVKIAVLDEADKMLDMGFFQDVSKILDKLPKKKQITMFSATITREVMDIMWLYQRDAVEITVTPADDNEPRITQYAVRVENTLKIPLLTELIRVQGYQRVMVFCNTKRMTERLVRELQRQKFNAEGLSSDIAQQIRTKIMNRFKAHDLHILVATDVAARGIDISDVDCVINYDVPQDNTYYLHRIGRTGRAKKEGVAFVFYNLSEYGKLKEIMRYTHSDIQPVRLENGQLVETDQW